MIQMNRFLQLLGFLFLTLSVAFAQDGPPENWFNLDEDDGVPGIGVEKTYKELLKNRGSATVVVAVIDSGVDAEHEDLENVMWVNPGEIAGNGIDDDGNGYIDDIHGWNFIGGPNGNVNEDTYEVTRLYKKYKYKYDNIKSEDGLTKKEKAEYEKFQVYKKEVEESREQAQTNLDRIKGNESMIMGALDYLESIVGYEAVTQEVVDSIAKIEEQQAQVAGNIAKNLMEEAPTVPEMREAIKDQFKGAYDYYNGQLEYSFNPEFDPRDIVGDDYSDPTERIYGNNQVEGPDAFHGTHVAGIIGAERNNDLGINGVADNVQIMSIRTVPNGDERDKDVANAIRYAVDNGAQIVNMSFGKAFSWNEKVVEDAILYAMENDVLLVHAAGNSNQDNDTADNFPNDSYVKKFLFWKKDKEFSNWIEVGALNYINDENYVAPFSNYGKANVDIFAPGMAIYSTTPDNKYQNAQGTSMASPVVAGAAALLRSYFPTLSAEQVKEILLESSETSDMKVKKPGSDELVPFNELSVSGGKVNIYKAVQKAMMTPGENIVKRKA